MAKGWKIGKKSWSEAGRRQKWLDYLTTDGRLLSPKKHLVEQIHVAAAGGEQGGRNAGTTELDSHADMVVIGV